MILRNVQADLRYVENWQLRFQFIINMFLLLNGTATNDREKSLQITTNESKKYITNRFETFLKDILSQYYTFSTLFFIITILYLYIYMRVRVRVRVCVCEFMYFLHMICGRHFHRCLHMICRRHGLRWQGFCQDRSRP